MIQHTKTYYDWQKIKKALEPDSVQGDSMDKYIDSQHLSINRETNYKNSSYLVEIFDRNNYRQMYSAVITRAMDVIYFINGWLIGRRHDSNAKD